MTTKTKLLLWTLIPLGLFLFCFGPSLLFTMVMPSGVYRGAFSGLGPFFEAIFQAFF